MYVYDVKIIGFKRRQFPAGPYTVSIIAPELSATVTHLINSLVMHALYWFSPCI